MSSRTYFFPPVANLYPVLDDFDAVYAATLRAINDLHRSWCPVCRRFTTDTEAHIVNSEIGQCNRIVNISIP